MLLSVCLCMLAYPAMSMWLNKTGRPILFSCSWPAYQEGSMKVSFDISSVQVERVLNTVYHTFIITFITCYFAKSTLFFVSCNYFDLFVMLFILYHYCVLVHSLTALLKYIQQSDV